MGKDRDKIEKFIKYNMHVQYLKSVILKALKKTFSSKVNFFKIRKMM